MKKRTRKLTLVRETLVALEDGDLRQFPGGAYLTSIDCIFASFCECTHACALPADTAGHGGRIAGK